MVCYVDYYVHQPLLYLTINLNLYLTHSWDHNNLNHSYCTSVQCGWGEYYVNENSLCNWCRVASNASVWILYRVLSRNDHCWNQQESITMTPFYLMVNHWVVINAGHVGIQCVMDKFNLSEDEAVFCLQQALRYWRLHWKSKVLWLNLHQLVKQLHGCSLSS